MTHHAPDLCCTHGAKLDRAVELLEELVAARAGKPKLATGGFVEGPPTPIEIDLRHEQVITADEARKDPQVRGALQKLTQERADPRRAAQAAADAIKESD